MTVDDLLRLSQGLRDQGVVSFALSGDGGLSVAFAAAVQSGDQNAMSMLSDAFAKEDADAEDLLFYSARGNS